MRTKTGNRKRSWSERLFGSRRLLGVNRSNRRVGKSWRSPASCRPRVEWLEDRRLLSVDPVSLSSSYEIAAFEEDLNVRGFGATGAVPPESGLTNQEGAEAASQRPYVANEILVAFRSDASVADVGRFLEAASVADELTPRTVVDSRLMLSYAAQKGGVTSVVKLTLNHEADVESALEAVEASSVDVLWAAPNYIYQGEDPRELVPNDPMYGSQFHHSLMQNDLAWDTTLGDAGVIVAVTDDGVDLDHEDLAANIWVNLGEIAGNGIDDDANGYIDDVNGWDFSSGNNDPNPNSASDEHGTHVAGISAARTNNALGVAGTAGQATIMPLQWYGPGAWTSAVILDTFSYAVDNGASIVTTSYNMDGWVGDPAVIAGYDYMLANGVLHLNSAGNNDQLNPPRQAFEQTLLVASTTATDAKSSFSNYGTGIDIAAPGSSILSTVPGDSYATFSGTSMAAPNAAGVAALIWSAYPTWNLYQVAAQLVGTADDLDALNPGYAGLLGGGRANSFRGVTETLPAPRVDAVEGLPPDGGSTWDPIDGVQVEFDQILDPTSVDNASNYELRGAGGDGLFDTVDDVLVGLARPSSYMVGTNRVDVDVAGGLLEIGEYRFTIFSDGIVNPFLTPLDGDGNGTGGDDYVSHFSVTRPPLEPVAPLGSLVYDVPVAGSITVPGEIDSLTIDLDAGQTITVVVDPDVGMQPSVELFDPGSSSIGTATAGTADEDAVLQTVATTGAGTYTLTVRGVGVSTGAYTAQIVLNAAVEMEQHDGPRNDDYLSAQNINASFISLGSGSAERGAVLGISDGGDGFTESQTQVDNAFNPNVLTYDFAGGPTPAGDGTLRVSAIADLDLATEYLTLNAEGLFSIDLFVAGGQQMSLVSTVVPIPLADLLTLAADGTITFTVTPSSNVNDLVGTEELTLELQYPTLPPSEDYYSFDLLAGQSSTLALTGEAAGNVTLELYDVSGTLLALAAGAANVDQVINNFVAPGAGMYYARVSGGSADYSLVITRDTDFDTETNDELAEAQDITPDGTALGHVGQGEGFSSGSASTVDVLYYMDFGYDDYFTTAFANVGITPTVATGVFDLTTRLNTGSWDLVVLLQHDVAESMWVTPLVGYVNDGGRAILADWAIDGVAASAFGASYTGMTNETEIAHGDHPIWEGISDPFALMNPGYGVFSMGLTPTSGESMGVFPSGDSGLVVGNDGRTIINGFLFDSIASPAEGVSLAENMLGFILGAAEDFYRFEAVAGNPLAVNVSRPMAGPGEFVNDLDVAVELFDPAGTAVAFSSSGSLTHPAALTGTYTVRVLAENDTEGEYVVEVTGHTGPTLPFEVVATDPADEQRLPESPPTFTADFNDTVLITSFEAADLVIDGGPATATGVAPDDGDTVVFDLPSLGEGWHTVSIAAGAVEDIQGTPVESYTGDFYLDLTAPRVIASSIQEADVVPVGTLAYTAEFDEELDASALDSADVRLVGSVSGSHAATTFNYSYDSGTGSSVLTVQFDDLPDDSYTLTLFSGDGQFEDLVGHDLDGETPAWPIPPNTSGDGVPGGDFAVTFTADLGAGSYGYPVPLVPKDPLGSLIYDPPVWGVIGAAGDIDSYTIDVDAGQTITVVVDPGSTLQPTVVLSDSSGPIGGPVTAAAAGEDAVVQTAATTGGGTYTVTVSGWGSTTGSYRAEVILNAAVEDEEHDGPGNDDYPSAQDLGASFISLGSGSAERGAVLGTLPTEPGPLEDWYRFMLDDGNTATIALSALTEGSLSLDLYDSDGTTLLAIGVGAANLDQVIHNFLDTTTGGTPNTYFARVSGADADYALVVTRNADFDTEANNDFASAQDISTMDGALGHVKGASGTGASLLANAVRSGAAEWGGPAVADRDLVPTPSITLPYNSDLTFEEAMALLGAGVAQTNAESGQAVAELLESSIVGPLPILQEFPGPGATLFIPPDPIAAAGPEQIVAVVNADIGIYDKATGTELFLQSTQSFFASVGSTTVVFDPWVLFDADTGRFFFIGIDIASDTQSNVFLAVSTDATPTSGADWHKYKIDFTHDGSGGLGSGAHFPDYPKMGVDQDAIWISGNYFPIDSGSGVYAGITAFEKTPLLSGAPLNMVYEEHFNGFSVFPMTQYGSAPAEYFVESSTGGGSSLVIHEVANVLTSAVRTTTVITVPSYSFPNDVPQLGGGLGADAIDARVMTGVWRDGSMWFAHPIEDPAIGDGEVVARWYEVETGSISLVQSGNVDPGPGVHAWMPAIAVDGRGNMGIGFSIGGPGMYFGAGFTGRLASDPPGDTILPVTTLMDGLNNYDTGGRNRWGDYSGISIDPADDATFWVFNEYASASANTWATHIGAFQLESPVDDDWYQFAVNAGDAVTLETFTPADGPFELVNALDPAIELYAPDGSWVLSDDNSAPDGRNALIAGHVATQTGSYRVRLSGVDSQGEYFLRVNVGASTAGNPAPYVVDTDPDNGQVVSTFPTTYTLDLTESLLISSVQAGDLLIGGLAALSVTPLDGDTFEFEVDPNANIGDGIYSVVLAQGAVMDLQSVGNVAFSGSFELDTTGPRVIASSVREGEVVSIPPDGRLVYTATFDEDLMATSSARRGPYAPGLDDVVLFEVRTAQFFSPTSVAYDAVSDTFTASYDGLPEGDYSLSLLSGDNAFEDLVGNDLDGEPLAWPIPPNVSGDGTAGGDFSVNFTYDAVQSEANAFERLAPFGGLMSESADNWGLINVPGDEDDFTFFAEAGQTITAAVYPDESGATTSIELVGLAGPFFSPGPGEPAVLPLQPAPADGTYTVRVGAATTGLYELRIGKDLIAEVFDTDPANPLDVDDSFVDLGSGRYGVLGTSEGREVTLDGLVWGVQPASGLIVLVDPTTGAVLHSFNAPDALSSADTQVGLSIAEGGDSLLYVNSDESPGMLYRLNPFTGAVLSIETTAVNANDGLGFETLAQADVTIYEANMDTDPGWTLEGQWAYGVPTGGGSYNLDPTSGNTGANVIGYNLNGDYADLIPAYYTTTPAMDASSYTDVTLSFYRWLGVEQATYDQASIQASNNGSTWTTVWDHTGSDIIDNSWTLQTIDISAVADGQSTVYIRWGMGPTDGSVTYPGWNIDDVVVTGTLAFPPGIYLGRDLVEVTRQEGFSGSESSHLTSVAPSGAVGGDDAGRQFVYVPGSGNGNIVEFDPRAVETTISTFTAPAAGIEGLAFDGTDLYASDPAGNLYTLNPADGTVLGTTSLTGGGLYGLGAWRVTGDDDGGSLEPNDAIPEATSTGLSGTGSVFYSADIGDGAFGTTTGDYDVFEIFALAGDNIQVDIDADVFGSLLDSLVILYNSVGVVIDSNDDGPGSFDSFLDTTVLVDGFYYIFVADLFTGFPSDPFTPGTGGGALGFIDSYDVSIGINQGWVPNATEDGASGKLAVEVFSTVVLPEIDEYRLDLTGKAGQPIDIVLAGQDDVDFSEQLLELRDSSGNLLVTARPDPLPPGGGVPAENYDLGILDFIVPADGLYTLRLTSTVNGDYGIVVTDPLIFDSEPNDATTDPLRSLDDAGTALGFLGGGGGGRLFAVQWADAGQFGIIYELEAATGAVLNSFPTPSAVAANPYGINLAFDGDSLWYNDGLFGGDNRIYELDPDDGSVLDSFLDAGADLFAGLGYVDGELFACDGVISVYDVTDPSYPLVRTIPNPDPAESVGVAGNDAAGTLYLVSQSQTIYELDPLTGAVLRSTSIPSLNLEQGLAVVGEELFVSETGDSGGPQDIAVYDLATLTLQRRMSVPLSDMIAGLGGDGAGGSGDGTDLYTITLAAGETLVVYTETPFDHPDNTPRNELDPALVLYDPSSGPVDSDSDREDGKNARIVYVATTGGVYTIEVSGEEGTGEYVLRTEIFPQPLPWLSIDDVDVVEGDSGTTQAQFTVSLSEAPTAAVTVQFDTYDDTATLADGDYAAKSVLLTFNPGDPLTQIVNVDVAGDTQIEPNEVFFARLSGAANAIIADPHGVGAIFNDDTQIRIDDVQQLEGDGGVTDFVFTVSLVAPLGVPLTVDYATSDASATAAGLDYLSAGGTLTFLPGETMKTITVSVLADTQIETDQEFHVDLSNPSPNEPFFDGKSRGTGTILNDDTEISIDDVAVLEGDFGTTAFSFTVSLAAAVHVPVTVTVYTADGTASVTDDDYVPLGGMPLTFDPGVTQRTATVNVIGDVKVEPDETFRVNLTNASQPMADAQGIGTILGDDVAQPDLVGRTLDADPDHVLAGQTTVNFTIDNVGPDPAGEFKVDIVLSDNEIIGDGDDMIVGQVTYSGLAGGGSLSDSIAVDLRLLAAPPADGPLGDWYAWAVRDNPPGMPLPYVSTGFEYIAVVIDSENQVAEWDETNNFNRGEAIDKDDVTYFPWDYDGNGVVTATDAMSVLTQLGQTVPPADPRADMDGNGVVTPTEAMAVLTRLGYQRNDSVTASLSLRLPRRETLFASEVEFAPEADVVRLSMDLVELDGTPGLVVGEQFDVVVHFTEIATAGSIFSGYADVLFDPARFRVDSITHDPDYPFGRTGIIDNVAGLVDEAGATDGLTPPADGVVFTLRLTALAAGSTTITSRAGQDLLSEIVIFDDPTDYRTQTSFGALPVDVADDVDTVDVWFELLDLSGDPNKIVVGEAFDLHVHFDDIRNPLDVRAVFSGYIDVFFDPALVRVDGITHDTDYPFARTGGIDNTTGLVDEAGASDGLVPPAETVVFTLHLTALAAGDAMIRSDSPQAIASEIVVFGDETDQRFNTRYGDILVPVSVYGDVVARHIFYNNSKWDGHAGFEAGDPAANEFDDAAIATDKTALLPGQTATFANYTGYHRGINGIIVDIRGLADPSAVRDDDFSEFTFKVGNSDDLTQWLPAPDPADVDVRDLGGGLYRVTIVWPDNAIGNKNWLQVTVKEHAATNLEADDVFYFGNSSGENTGNFRVDYGDAFDVIWPLLFTSEEIGVDHPGDVNRDGRIDYSDIFDAVWPNLFGPSPLVQLTAPAAPAAPAARLQSSDFVFDENLPWAIELVRLDESYGSSSDSEEDDPLEATAVDGVFAMYDEE